MPLYSRKPTWYGYSGLRLTLLHWMLVLDPLLFLHPRLRILCSKDSVVAPLP
jgi:hypothetical protein